MDANHKLFKKKYLKILSCYDATSASIAKLVGCDAVLIGDSIGVLVLGHANTSEIGINTLLEFLKIIKKQTRLPIIADLPAKSMISTKKAVQDAKKLIHQGADIIKIEGHEEVIELIQKLKSFGIAVCSHIGQMPQKKITKQKPLEYTKIAKSLEQAGADMIVLSKMTSLSNRKISECVNIPTIGYQNSKFCRGKVDVLYAAMNLIKGEEIKININQQSQVFKTIKKFFQNK